MKIRLNSVLISVFFFVLPFLYFYFNAIQFHSKALVSSEIIYPIFVLVALFFSSYLEKSLRKDSQSELKKSLFRIVMTCAAIYALYLLFMTWYRYANFISEVIDVQYFHQAIWQLSEFKIPYIWNLNQRIFPIWSQHFSPILIFLAPIYWFFHDAGILMFVQALAAISGAIPIYLISKRYLRARSIGLALSFAYLAFGGLEFGFEYGFHEILFFPALFLWAYYFYLGKKTKSYFLFIILSLFVKEEVAFIVLFWSIYLLVVKKDRNLGILTGALGLMWYFLCFNIIFPYFNQGKGFGYWGQYDTDGSSGLLGVIKSIVFKPLQFLLTLVTPTLKIETMLITFGQFSFLLFLFPPALIIIFPSLMEKLLSSGIAMGNGAHYSTAIAAVTVIATIEALPHIYKNKLINRFVHDKNVFFTILIFYMALVSNIFFGFPAFTLVPGHLPYYLEKNLTDDNYQFLTKILSQIPQNATVSSQYQITPHLNKNYRDVTTWPGMTGTEDFVIIDTQMVPVLGATSQEYNSAIDKLNKNNNYQLAVSNFGILVYRKKSYNLPQVPQ